MTSLMRWTCTARDLHSTAVTLAVGVRMNGLVVGWKIMVGIMVGLCMLDLNAKTQAFDTSFSPDSIFDTEAKIARTNRRVCL